ncbi:hypothetical protein NDU88_007575 [Pleurodeles waltl]|uniref:Uncharacterized protein n=1 Tax=Pleurodeles waltl TaxID=8319 RepID=A0AAV7MQM0_PLEWA|nr:hypothetical protein NDU88_007575 [Pleurodeles waltl]
MRLVAETRDCCNLSLLAAASFGGSRGKLSLMAESMPLVSKIPSDTGDLPSVTNLTRHGTFVDLSLLMRLRTAVTLVLLFVRISRGAVSRLLSLHATALKRMFYGKRVSVMDTLKLLVKDQKSAFL